MIILDYDNKVFTYFCPDCNEVHSQDMTDARIAVNEENGEYYPVGLVCLECEKNGRDNVTFLNVNIPIIDDMEVEVMEHLADEMDRNARRQIRKFIWDFLPELKNVNRTQYETDYAEQNAERLAMIRAKITSGDNS